MDIRVRMYVKRRNCESLKLSGDFHEQSSLSAKQKIKPSIFIRNVTGTNGKIIFLVLSEYRLFFEFVGTPCIKRSSMAGAV